MTPTHESRPAGNGAAEKSFAGDYSHYSNPDIDAAWWDGWTFGRAEGILRGYELADAEAAARHAEAARVVLANLGVERDVEADRRRAEKSRAYWAARRGEGGAA